MLIYELLPLSNGVHEIIDISPEQADLSRHLRIPEDIRYERCEPAKAETLDIGKGGLLLSLVGDSPKHADPNALGPVLAALKPGAQVILLLGWTIEDLPYHRLLGSLVDGRCQVIEAVPLDGVGAHGAYCALMVERVDRLAPLHSYLTDIREESVKEATPENGTVDELRTVLRMANEYVLADLVARPMRRRLREQETQIAELTRLLAERTAKLTKLESSASFQVGRAVVQGLRQPGRGVVTVPRDLVRVWRSRSRKARRPTQPTRDV